MKYSPNLRVELRRVYAPLRVELRRIYAPLRVRLSSRWWDRESGGHAGLVHYIEAWGPYFSLDRLERAGLSRLSLSGIIGFLNAQGAISRVKVKGSDMWYVPDMSLIYPKVPRYTADAANEMKRVAGEVSLSR